VLHPTLVGTFAMSLERVDPESEVCVDDGVDEVGADEVGAGAGAAFSSNHNLKLKFLALIISPK
jgi:hypothetical protein